MCFAEFSAGHNAVYFDPFCMLFCPAYKIHDLRALKGRTYTQKRVDFVHLKRIQRVGDRKSKKWSGV